MARYYDLTFRSTRGDYKTITVRGYGNTRRSAERAARVRLRDDHRVDPKDFYTVSCTFAGGEGR